MENNFIQNTIHKPGANLEEVARYFVLRVSDIFDEVLFPIQQETIAINNIKLEKKSNHINPVDLEILEIEAKQKLDRLINKHNNVLTELINCAKYIVLRLVGVGEGGGIQAYSFLYHNLVEGDLYSQYRNGARKIGLLGAMIMLNGIEYDRYTDIDFFALKRKAILNLRSPEKLAEEEINILRSYKIRKRFRASKAFKRILHFLLSSDHQQEAIDLINHIDAEKNSLLHYCVMTGSVDLCTILVRNQYNKNSLNNYMKTPFNVAFEGYNLKTMKLMLDEGVECSTAMKMKYMDIFKRLGQ